jgi:N-acetyl-gamma-glutamyl-phosphate reductase
LVALAGTNDAELHISRRGRVVRVLSALDNLGKGAAGEALQNLNLMFGYPEECALNDCAIVI